MPVLILGASGFLGSWAARAFIARGERPVVLVRPESALWRLVGLKEHIDIVRAPLSEWPAAIADARPSTVLTLAKRSQRSA